jgi:hypothetical protein
VSTSAAIATRTITPAAGDQPASISDVANAPDVPNAAADVRPRAIPAPRPVPEPERGPGTLARTTAGVGRSSTLHLVVIRPLPITNCAVSGKNDLHH